MLQLMHILIQIIFVLVAFILDSISLANRKGFDTILPVALIIAVVSVSYIVIVWRRQGFVARIISSLICIVALWVVYDAGHRMLQSI